VKQYILTALLFVIVFSSSILKAEDGVLSEWNSFSHTAASRELVDWMQSTLREMLNGDTSAAAFPAAVPPYYGRYGIFITLICKGTTRGCFGSFYHDSDDLRSVLKEYLRSALRNDPRYKPLEPYELKDTRVVMTIASQPYPVDNLQSVDLSRYGVEVLCDDEQKIVFVPFEVKTADYIMRTLRGRRVVEYAAFRSVTIQ